MCGDEQRHAVGFLVKPLLFEIAQPLHPMRDHSAASAGLAWPQTGATAHGAATPLLDKTIADDKEAGAGTHLALHTAQTVARRARLTARLDGLFHVAAVTSRLDGPLQVNMIRLRETGFKASSSFIRAWTVVVVGRGSCSKGDIDMRPDVARVRPRGMKHTNVLDSVAVKSVKGGNAHQKVPGGHPAPPSRLAHAGWNARAACTQPVLAPEFATPKKTRDQRRPWRAWCCAPTESAHQSPLVVVYTPVKREEAAVGWSVRSVGQPGETTPHDEIGRAHV